MVASWSFGQVPNDVIQKAEETLNIIRRVPNRVLQFRNPDPKFRAIP